MAECMKVATDGQQRAFGVVETGGFGEEHLETDSV